MKLYFSKPEEERLIAEPADYGSAMTEIMRFLKQHHYTAPYIRGWQENGGFVYDVGSHNEFFVLRKDVDNG